MQLHEVQGVKLPARGAFAAKHICVPIPLRSLYDNVCMLKFLTCVHMQYSYIAVDAAPNVNVACSVETVNMQHVDNWEHTPRQRAVITW